MDYPILCGFISLDVFIGLMIVFDSSLEYVL